MNKKRRRDIKLVNKSLSVCLNDLQSIYDDESDAMDEYPENLQSTETYSSMENAVDILSDAIDNIESSIECLESLI